MSSQLMRLRVRVISQSNKSAEYESEVYTVSGIYAHNNEQSHLVNISSPTGKSESRPQEEIPRVNCQPSPEPQVRGFNRYHNVIFLDMFQKCKEPGGTCVHTTQKLVDLTNWDRISLYSLQLGFYQNNRATNILEGGLGLKYPTVYCRICWGNHRITNRPAKDLFWALTWHWKTPFYVSVFPRYSEFGKGRAAIGRKVHKCINSVNTINT